ncbi:MAG TPA: hypothetical protein VGF59_16975 [Bryobacteraceae bacterium]|jgi:hypothetical protein
MKKLWLLPVLALGLYGADIEGKWSGTIEVTDPSGGEKIATPVKAEFTKKPDGIAGKIGRAEDSDNEPIRNARLDGKNLVFEVRSPETASTMKFSLVLVSDDRIEGDMKGSVDVGAISGKVKLQKAK